MAYKLSSFTISTVFDIFTLANMRYINKQFHLAWILKIKNTDAIIIYKDTENVVVLIYELPFHEYAQSFISTITKISIKNDKTYFYTYIGTFILPNNIVYISPKLLYFFCISTINTITI